MKRKTHPRKANPISTKGFSLKTEKKHLKPDKGWRLLEHTADVRLEAHGAALKDLFINAARGFTDLILPDTELTAQTEVEMSLEADSAEELLVDWLRELLFLHQARRFVMTDAHMIALSENDLKAKVSFGINPPDVEPPLEIKGVTYHGLSIVEKNEGYLVKIVFDI
jgi:SHS2 domain-containing protein